MAGEFRIYNVGTVWEKDGVKMVSVCEGDFILDILPRVVTISVRSGTTVLVSYFANGQHARLIPWNRIAPAFGACMRFRRAHDAPNCLGYDDSSREEDTEEAYRLANLALDRVKP